MRFLIVLMLLPGLALAKPKVAVAPFEGDPGNKVATAVAKALEDDAEVTSPKATGRAMDSLDLSGELDKKAVKKLRGKLEVDVIVQGSVSGKKRQKTVELRLAGKGVKPQTVSIKFKNAASTKFRDDVKDELGKRLGAGGGDDEADEDDKPKRLVDAERDEEGRKKHEKEKADRDAEEEKQRKRRDDDERRAKKREARKDEDAREGDGDDGEDREKTRKAKKKKRRHAGDEDDGEGDDAEPAPRHPVTQVAVRVNAGAGFGRRTLSYSGPGMTKPPGVGTAGASGAFEAEVYPGATSTLKGIAASLGIYAAFDKTLGVSIRVPGTTVDAAINQGHYAIGVRYRIPIGSSSLAFGAAYARWHYIADRSGLMAPTALDMPDVDYAALAPGVMARIAATDSIGVFAGGDVMLMLGAGPIVETTNYGFANILAFEISTGVDIALAKNYALRFAADVTQFGLSFTDKGMSRTRGVSSATDRLLGLTATFAVTY